MSSSCLILLVLALYNWILLKGKVMRRRRFNNPLDCADDLLI